jgi:hemoglobin/transferrin/lactoferrin receptor protein
MAVGLASRGTVRGVWPVLVLFSLLASVLVGAQQRTGRVEGTVYDDEGMPMPGARVTVSSAAGGARSTSTAADGSFRFLGLIPGELTVRVAKAGFRAEVREEIQVGADKTVTLDILLERMATSTGDAKEERPEPGDSRPTPDEPSGGVSAKPSGETYVITATRSVISATRSRRRNLDVAEKVSVIEGREIAERVEQNPVNLMRWEAGVRVDNGPAPYQENVSIRSLGGERVLLTLDGRRWATTAGVHGGLFNVDMSDVKRIEVLRGAASSLYGSRAIGGVVNVISLEPVDRLGPEASLGAGVTLGYSSVNNAFRELGRVYGAHLGRAVQWQLSASRTDAGRYKDSNGDVVSAGYDATSVSAKAILMRTDHRLDVSGGYLLSNPVLNDGEAGLDTPSDIKTFLRDVTRKKTDNYRASLGYSYRPEGRLRQLELSGYLSGGTTDDIHDDDYIRHGQPYLFSIQSSSRYSTVVFGFEPRATIRLSGGTFANELTVGALGELERASHAKDETETSYASPADRTFVDRSSSSSAMFPDVAFWTVAAYIQDEISLFNRLSLVPGLRYDHFFFVPDSGTAGYATEGFDASFDTKDAGSLSPKLSATYRLLRNWSVSAIAAHGFRMTGPETRYYNFYHAGGGGFYVQGDPNLAPESSWNFEVGTKASVWKVWISASGFWVEASDFVPDVPMGGYQNAEGDFIRPFKNIGHLRLYGTELECEARGLLGHLDIKLSFTAMGGRAFDVPIIDETTGVQIGEEDKSPPVVPAFGTLNVAWKMQHGRLGWYAAVDLRLQDKQLGTVFDYRTNADVDPPPGFVLVGLAGGLSWDRRYRLNAGVTNLLNTTHQDPQSRLLVYGPPLAAFISLTADL